MLQSACIRLHMMTCACSRCPCDCRPATGHPSMTCQSPTTPTPHPVPDSTPYCASQVLAVEILGGLAMIPYALTLVLRVVQPPVQLDAKGVPSTVLDYHIRYVRDARCCPHAVHVAVMRACR